jgi:hypothetical protein
MVLNTNTQTGFPPTFLNAYVNSELKEFGLIPDGPNPFPTILSSTKSNKY